MRVKQAVNYMASGIKLSSTTGYLILNPVLSDCLFLFSIYTPRFLAGSMFWIMWVTTLWYAYKIECYLPSVNSAGKSLYLYHCKELKRDRVLGCENKINQLNILMWCLSRSGTLYFNDEIFGLPGFIIRITAESWPFREVSINPLIFGSKYPQ